MKVKRKGYNKVLGEYPDWDGDSLWKDIIDDAYIQEQVSEGLGKGTPDTYDYQVIEVANENG